MTAPNPDRLVTVDEMHKAIASAVQAVRIEIADVVDLYTDNCSDDTAERALAGLVKHLRRTP